MTPIEQQLQTLQTISQGASITRLPSGAHLVTVPEVRMPRGWNQVSVTILFVAPPGYPIAQPDCFWVEPKGIRLENNATPQGTNDSNPIPEIMPPRQCTWFSWHLQHWNPNNDTLMTYFNAIMHRFRTLQ
jgi:hypothetical protein